MNRKLLLIIPGLILMMFTSVSAQTFDDYLEVAREVLKTEKKAAVAEAMQLSETESGPFWELYNDYNAELYKVHTERVNIIKDFASHYDSLTDVKADELLNNMLSYQTHLLDLNKAYYKKFKKVLPAGKVARYFQIENKIETLIAAQLAEEIPLVETN
jgi:hypothetical protein